MSLVSIWVPSGSQIPLVLPTLDVCVPVVVLELLLAPVTLVVRVPAEVTLPLTVVPASLTVLAGASGLLDPSEQAATSTKESKLDPRMYGSDCMQGPFNTAQIFCWETKNPPPQFCQFV